LNKLEAILEKEGLSPIPGRQLNAEQLHQEVDQALLDEEAGLLTSADDLLGKMKEWN